jgi:hypothetical protein
MLRDLVHAAFMWLDGVVDSPGGGPGEEHRIEVSAPAVPLPEEERGGVRHAAWRRSRLTQQ